jgi:hypothetical protein
MKLKLPEAIFREADRLQAGYARSFILRVYYTKFHLYEIRRRIW